MHSTYKNIFKLIGLSFVVLSLSNCSDNHVAEVDQAQPKQVSTAADVKPNLCEGYGPQTPRDISNKIGSNNDNFEWAPSYTKMNLCNIHTHTNAEHKGPGFNLFVGDSVNGGFACNETATLTKAELQAVDGSFGDVQSGDTIEVHWVHTSCDTNPGVGLAACVPASCNNPVLRVEAQVFLLVNDQSAADFTDMVNDLTSKSVLHQAKFIPNDTGTPVIFRGSTTGPDYSQSNCSEAKVTWSVRPQCRKLDINSLHTWAETDTTFNEKKSHGVRSLVTAPELLAPIP